MSVSNKKEEGEEKEQEERGIEGEKKRGREKEIVMEVAKVIVAVLEVLTLAPKYQTLLLWQLQ